MSKTVLARRRGFQCVHRYEVPSWSEEKNQGTFGACFTPTGHGHNYELEAYFEGPVDPETGMILNLVDVDFLLKKAIEPIEGKHLNFEVEEFKNSVPTTEAIAGYLFARLNRSLAAAGFLAVRLNRVRLYEYEDLWVDVWP